MNLSTLPWLAEFITIRPAIEPDIEEVARRALVNAVAEDFLERARQRTGELQNAPPADAYLG